MEFMKWLKRIFSVGTITLIVTIIVGFITYMAFIRDSPGKLSLTMTDRQLDKRISVVYVLATTEIGSIDFVYDVQMPVLGNLTQRKVTDCTAIFEFYTNFDFSPFPEYMFKVDSTKTVPYVSMARRRESIGYMDGESFPLMSIGVSPYEPQLTTFGWTYIHRGMKKPTTLNVRLVTVPKEMIRDGGEDYAFLKVLQPYLLEERSLKNVAIVHGKTIIEKPRNVKSLKSLDIKGLTIKDLR